MITNDYDCNRSLNYDLHVKDSHHISMPEIMCSKLVLL